MNAWLAAAYYIPVLRLFITLHSPRLSFHTVLTGQNTYWLWQLLLLPTLALWCASYFPH